MRLRLKTFELPEYVDTLSSADRKTLGVLGAALPRSRSDMGDSDNAEDTLIALEGNKSLKAIDDDGNTVGAASYYFPEGKDYLYLSAIAVAKRYRDMGIGRAMIEYLAQGPAKSANRSAIELTSLTQAVEFYRHIGAYGVGRPDKYRMRLDIS